MSAQQTALDPFGEKRPVLHLTDAEMERLLEYSATIPTGKTIGKRWRRALRRGNPWTGEGDMTILGWVVGEYAELSPEDQLKYPEEIAINWYLPSVDGGAPGRWRMDKPQPAPQAQAPQPVTLPRDVAERALSLLEAYANSGVSDEVSLTCAQACRHFRNVLGGQQ